MKAISKVLLLSIGLVAGSVAFAEQGSMDQGADNGAMPQAGQEQDVGSQGISEVSPDTLNKEDLRKLQAALNEAGYQSGPEDGIWGPKTEGALHEFQQAKGISAVGQVDDETISALGLSTADFAAFSETPQRDQLRQQDQLRTPDQDRQLDQDRQRDRDRQVDPDRQLDQQRQMDQRRLDQQR